MTQTDVLIIGSGPVGSAYARLTAERRPGTSITMIELGPLVSDPPGANVRNMRESQRDAARVRSEGRSTPAIDGVVPLRIEGTITAPGGTYLASPGRQPGMPAAALSACVGGMGVHWTCATPTPNDDERIPFIPEWELREAFHEAERLLAVTTLPQNPYGLAIQGVVSELFADELPEDRLPGPLPMSAIPQADGSIRWGGADTVLGDTDLDLRPDTICRRLLVEGNTIVGAVVEHLPTATIEKISARVVVVAANAIQTPQLLWASGIRPDPLGRYLTEHVLVYSVVELSDEIVRRAGTDVPVAELVKDPTASTIGVPYTQGLHPFRTQIMHLAFSPIPSTKKAGAAGYVAMGNGVRKYPRAQDRLVFSDTEQDQWGMPAITIEYGLSQREKDEIDAAIADLTRTATRLGSFVAGGEPRLMPNGTSLHYKGTIRMGVDGGAESVVDDHSRVWGFTNLFLGGNGLIPTATVTNPTLTSVALAVRAIPALLAVLGSKGLQ